MIERRPALGKGLSALIPEAPEQPRQGAVEVDIDLLTPNEEQPRLSIDDGKLNELAASIKANGIIQPILVRRTENTYRIIAGERRWRAAQLAGLLKVPVVVREVAEGSDRQLLELALVENIQREDLNPVDEALAYQRLADEFGLTQEQIAAAVGQGSHLGRQLPSALAPTRRRFGAPWRPGRSRWDTHGRILALPEAPLQRQAARDVVIGGLSVRETEALVKKLGSPTARPARQRRPPQPADVHTRAAEERNPVRSGDESAYRPPGSGRHNRDRIRVGGSN